MPVEHLEIKSILESAPTNERAPLLDNPYMFGL